MKVTFFHATLASCLLIALGAIGPWATVLGFTATGLDGDGLVMLGIAGLALLVLLVKRMYRTSIGLGVITTGIAIYEVVNLTTADTGPLDVSVAPGWGLILCLVAGLVLSCTSFAARKEARA